ncbi:MAG TPA: response regulator [Terracidiphilus sp.]|nr:response regulator [Terracidiphilus sp.]
MNQKKSRTTFPTVPLQELPESAIKASTEPYRPVVLVVDDEYVIADSLAQILKHNGYAAISAYDGEAALETALTMPPELLITDVILPGMNGVELAITIRRIFPECKVILSSGQPSSARLLSSADSAGHHFVFLNKPVHPTELLEHVSICLRARKQPAFERSPAEAAHSS